MAKANKDRAKELKDVREYCKAHNCVQCHYKDLCGKVPSKWTDKEIDRVAAE